MRLVPRTCIADEGSGVHLLEEDRLAKVQAQLRVLVVEDDASIREALCDVLRLAGYEAEGAENGRVGLAALDREIPDVILLDLRMPVMNGVEFLREITPRKLACRIIVLTANPQDLPPGTNLPMLAKPYDVERLLRVIDGAEA